MDTTRFNKKIRSTPIYAHILLVFFISISSFSFSQEKKRVDIIYSGYGESVEGMEANSQRLVDSVYIKHNEILMWCDTAYMYSNSNKVDAIGNVHIKQGDTLHLYANNVLYNGDIEFARAWGNVHLINKSTHIYSDTLDYDLAENISYYDDFGKIIDSTTTLTSIIGKYFLDEENIYFYKNVVGYNDDFTLNSDTVLYNTESGRIFVNGPTTIQDSVNTLYTENGWYDSKTGEAELLKAPSVYGETQQIDADYIKYNEGNGNGRALGTVRIEDFDNKSIVLGNTVEYNETLETAMVTDSAVYIAYSESDTLFLHADTLFTVPDTIEEEKIISAYYGVRFFRKDIQGVCDSLVYFTRDSVVQLYQNPVIWSDNHQLSANLIKMQQKSSAPDEIHLSEKSFIISEQDSGQYDQIKGKEMIGYVINQELNEISVNGNGQTLYYAREDQEIIGLNSAESSRILIRFLEGKIYKIIFHKQPQGELKPLVGLKEEDKRLRDFEWKIDQRPISKHDIFRKETEQAPETLDKSEEDIVPQN